MRASLLYYILLNAILLSRAHKHASYSHDEHTDNRNSKWMSRVSGQTPLRELSLPGTHDTMALKYGGDIAQCQSKPLVTQLVAGVRVLDIRCRHVRNSFTIHHGLVYEHKNFDDVLVTVRDFLRDNPSETVVMRVLEADTPTGNNETFEQTFAKYVSRYRDLLWNESVDSPRLADVRGKVVIMQNFTAGKAYGLRSKVFVTQDSYHLRTNWDLHAKWERIRDHLLLSSKGFGNGFFMNFLSGSGGSFPYFVASGHVSPGTAASRLSTGLTTPAFKHSFPDFPRVNCLFVFCTIAFEGTNVLTHEWIANKKPRFMGVIMADFPGDGLINLIIDLNLKN